MLTLQSKQCTYSSSVKALICREQLSTKSCTSKQKVLAFCVFDCHNCNSVCSHGKFSQIPSRELAVRVLLPNCWSRSSSGGMGAALYHNSLFLCVGLFFLCVPPFLDLSLIVDRNPVCVPINFQNSCNWWEHVTGMQEFVTRYQKNSITQRSTNEWVNISCKWTEECYLNEHSATMCLGKKHTQQNPKCIAILHTIFMYFFLALHVSLCKNTAATRVVLTSLIRVWHFSIYHLLVRKQWVHGTQLPKTIQNS